MVKEWGELLGGDAPPAWYSMTDTSVHDRSKVDLITGGELLLLKVLDPAPCSPNRAIY